MHRSVAVGAIAGLICASPLFAQDKPMYYPPAPKAEVVDTYHGVRVADPYRPLEDADAPETRAWVEAENKITFEFLSAIPQRESIKNRLTALWNYERYGLPTPRNGKYFYTRNSGLQNQGVLYVADSLSAEPRVLLDPNTLSADGTVALAGTELSEDGQLLAYALSAAGSDWEEWKVRDVATGKDLADHLKWVKFSDASWSKDGKGFFYSRFPQPKDANLLQAQNFYNKLYYHRLGTPQEQDRLVYERQDQKEWEFSGQVTDDGKYLIISVHRGTNPESNFLFAPLNADGSVGAITELLSKWDADYDFLGNDGPLFWFLTEKDAPRKRIIAIDTRNPEIAQWRELIPQNEQTIQSASVVGDRLFVRYLKDAATQVKVFALDGKLEREVDLPGIGTASGFAGWREDKETFYAFTSFTTPPSIYRYDLASGKSTLFRQPKVDFNPGDYETKQVFYSSKDGTRIPMFITHKKGLKLDGNNPTYLYGYGGFRISLTPSFSTSNLVWMERGGVYAVANLRGGGEYGQAWHDAGRLLNKQNVFDDFIAAGEYLIKNGYTSTPKLAIGGGSNGGLLVGAALTQRPDLFGAALPAVGVMDMLRFHKFTIGWGWTSDYGSPDNPEQFKALFAYSPLHNIKPGTRYPSTLITTSDHDDRVVPAHSYKFAATLQAAQVPSGPPVLIRIETKAGHGAGKPTTKIIEEAADRWAFLCKVLHME